MKRLCILLVAGFCVGACAAVSCAQEPEGLIPRLIKKWKGGGKEEAKPAARAPAVTPAVPAARPSVPSKPQAPAPAVPREASARAAQDAGQPQKTVIPKLAQMSKEELVAEIKDELDREDEIPSYIPGLGMQRAADGTPQYSFAQGGSVKALEDLDQDLLRNLLTRVRQTATKINTDRIQKQLETIRQAQRLQTMRPPEPPPRPPQVPQTPSVPRQPPQPPPQPPRR